MEERNEANDSGEQTEAERAYRWPPTDGNVIPDDATYIIVDEPGLEPSVLDRWQLPDGCPSLNGFEHLKRVDIAPTTKYLSPSIMSHCTKLEEIYIPDTVRGIGGSAFSRCTSLRKVRLPNNEHFTAIKAGTFSCCQSLTSIEIPSTVHTIEANAFRHCHSLKEITLPDSVEKIERLAFLSYSVQTIRLPNNPNLSVRWNSFFKFYSLCSITRPPSCMSQEQWLELIDFLSTAMIGVERRGPSPTVLQAPAVLHDATGGFNVLGQREFLATIPVKLWPNLFTVTSSSTEFFPEVKPTVEPLIFQHLRKHTGILLDSRMRRARRRPRRLGFE